MILVLLIFSPEDAQDIFQTDAVLVQKLLVVADPSWKGTIARGMPVDVGDEGFQIGNGNTKGPFAACRIPPTFQLSSRASQRISFWQN